METKSIRLAIIAAVGQNGVIGVDGELPWRLSSDLKRFKQITMGKPIIMGRKTYESIGKPLPGRKNIVVTRNPEFTEPGVSISNNVDQAIGLARQYAANDDCEEIYIIGGGEIYSRTMALADRLYMTHVLTSPAGDTRFPDINQKNWQLKRAEEVPEGEKDTVATRFAVYDRL